MPSFARLIVLACMSINSLLAIACGSNRYPVQGTVVWEDGSNATELAGGFVAFETPDLQTSGRGEIKSDGSFQIDLVKPGDGMPPGEYQVLVVQPPKVAVSAVRVLEPRFERYTSSGLACTVNPSRNSGIVLKVERFKKPVD